MRSWSSIAIASLALALAAGDARGQGGSVNPQCGNATSSQRASQDACQKALDLFQFMAPQLGVAIVGGNALLGEHSALRGPGHFSLGVRANVVQGKLPRIEDESPSLNGAVATNYETETQPIPVPTVDAAMGLFRGFPVAGSRALALDALVNVAYIPAVSSDDVEIETPEGSVKFGFGGRLGLIGETFVTPGVSVTYLRRDLPVVDVTGRVDDDVLNVRDIRVKTSAWRAVVGKNLAVFGLTVGAGQDTYETSATAQATVSGLLQSYTSDEVDATQDLTRENFFANVSLNLSLLRIVGEIGRVTGGKDVPTYNSFGGGAVNDARNYASFGLRLSW